MDWLKYKSLLGDDILGYVTILCIKSVLNNSETEIDGFKHAIGEHLFDMRTDICTELYCDYCFNSGREFSQVMSRLLKDCVLKDCEFRSEDIAFIATTSLVKMAINKRENVYSVLSAISEFSRVGILDDFKRYAQVVEGVRVGILRAVEKQDMPEELKNFFRTENAITEIDERSKEGNKKGNRFAFWFLEHFSK